MTVKLYTYTKDKIIADKSSYLTLLDTVSCDIIGDFNILKPTIKITKTANSLACNYVYIVELGVYFFVVDKQGLTAQHIELKLDNDVRYTYLNAIKLSDVTATRSNMYNKNIPDTMALSVPQQKITYRKLSQALTGESYIMIVGG